MQKFFLNSFTVANDYNFGAQYALLTYGNMPV